MNAKLAGVGACIGTSWRKLFSLIRWSSVITSNALLGAYGDVQPTGEILGTCTLNKLITIHHPKARTARVRAFKGLRNKLRMSLGSSTDANLRFVVFTYWSIGKGDSLHRPSRERATDNRMGVFA